MRPRLSLNWKLILVFAVGLGGTSAALFFVAKSGTERFAVESLVSKARAITIETENTRNYVETLRSKHKAFNDERMLADLQAAVAASKGRDPLEIAKQTDIYWTIPVVAAWNVGQTNAEKAGYEFRVPKIQPRNPKNEPTPFERAMLLKLTNENREEIFEIDTAENKLRYMRPIKLTKGCLLCHGAKADDPDGDGLDPLGLKMEGWADGETHGAFEVVADLKPVDQEVAATMQVMGGLTLTAVVVIGAMMVPFLQRIVIRPVKTAAGRTEETGRTIMGAAHQFSTSSQSLASSVSEQAASMEESSSAVEQLASTASSNAERAGEVERVIRGGVQSMSEGTTAMQELSGAMTGITESSGKLAELVKRIDGIAFQTNLLALNAAVEAARAGSHGAGFAVVADEVRNLAQRSAEAAKEAAAMIQESGTKVQAGTAVTRRVQETLIKVAGAIQQANQLSGEIAQASREQAEGIGQLRQAITQVDTVTQRNAATAEEFSATSQELTGQAESLSYAMQELLAVVGESGAQVQVEALRPGSGQATVQATRLSQPRPQPRIVERRALAGPAPAKGATKPTGAKVVKSQETIPLEGEFKDF